jgi:hypothetical protein
MTVSLLKTTQNPGASYTPNALLYGTFALTVDGPLSINAPTNTTDGQLIAVLLEWDDDTSVVSWASAYKSGGQTLLAGPCGVGTKWLHIFFCNDGNAHCIFSGEVT